MTGRALKIAGIILLIHFLNGAADQLTYPESQLNYGKNSNADGAAYQVSHSTGIPVVLSDPTARQQGITWPTDNKKLHDFLNQLYKKIQVNVNDSVRVRIQLYDRLSKIMAKVALYDPCFTFTVQFKGSTSEGLKIDQPDEFDFGLLNNYWTGKVVFSPATPPLPGFGFAVEQIKIQNCFTALEQAGTKKIDPVKIRGYLRTLVERAMKELGMDRDFIWEQGPAVSFEYPSGNPKFPLISVDLAIAIDLVNWPTVARRLPDAFTKARAQLVPKPVDNRPMLWQISFSQVEREIMETIDRDGGCRKKVLMLAKHLKTESWQPLSSYHLKMVLFHMNDERKLAKDWAPSMLVPRFQEFIERLLRNVKEARLPSYFVLGYNLLENKPGLGATEQGILNAVSNLGER